jgi:hypothetical protein
MTRIAYYKDGKEVSKPKSIIIGNTTYVPPTDEQLISIGYEIREVEIPEPVPYIPTYEERVVELIRLRYSIDAELAIQRQRDSKPEEFAEYNAYCEECKIQAKEEV